MPLTRKNTDELNRHLEADLSSDFLPEPLVIIVVHRSFGGPGDGVVMLSGSQCSGQDHEIIPAAQAEIDIELAGRLEEGVVDPLVELEGAARREVSAPVGVLV